MVFTSAEGTINVPVQDFVSFCFDKQVDIDEEESILIDANEPSRQLNTKQCRTLIRRLIAGWKACGLQDGETILCHIGNTVGHDQWIEIQDADRYSTSIRQYS